MGDDDDFCRIQTVVIKDEEPSVLQFSVTCTVTDESGEALGDPVGSLTGIVVKPGYIPDPGDQWWTDVFDAQSGHALDAVEILMTKHKLIERALGSEDLFGTGAIHLDDAKVAPAYRGRGLALRLMREAKHVFAQPGLLAILKAHPTGVGKVSNEQCRKLARYYASDETLGLKPLSPTRHAGWLVGAWDEAQVPKSDDCFWSPERTPKPSDD